MVVFSLFFKILSVRVCNYFSFLFLQNSSAKQAIHHHPRSIFFVYSIIKKSVIELECIYMFKPANGLQLCHNLSYSEYILPPDPTIFSYAIVFTRRL